MNRDVAEFSAKTIYITGAGSGMGLLSARMLAAQGANIVALDQSSNPETLKSIEAARASPEQRIGSFQLNVANREQTLAVGARAAAESGPPDILVNMAGIGGVAEMIDMKFETFDRMMQVNVYGTRNIVEADWR